MSDAVAVRAVTDSQSNFEKNNEKAWKNFVSPAPVRLPDFGRDSFAKAALGWLHPHDLVTAIDVNDLAGDGCSAVAGEKNSRGP